MLSGFFVSRPKFAFVISLVITIAGLIAMRALLDSARLPKIFDTALLMAADEDDDALEHDAKLGALAELARCEDANTAKPLGWPPEPLLLHGSFDRLPLDAAAKRR